MELFSLGFGVIIKGKALVLNSVRERMRIVKYIKNSLLDFPAHIATIAFTPGCNFHCWYCYNESLINQKVNDLISSTKEITLRFKISDENDEIPINTKGETKLSEVLSMLYDLCPNINNLNIKGFCKDGNENETIDEMKTVNENKLVDGTLIVLLV